MSEKANQDKGRENAQLIEGTDFSAIEATPFAAPDEKIAGRSSGTDSKSNTKPSFQIADLLNTNNQGAPWWHSQLNLMVAVFVLLAIAALLLIVVSPSPEDYSTSLAEELVQESAQGDPVQTPWEVSQQADLRRQAQEILESMLENKKSLEDIGVQEWGAEEYKKAIALAEAGDEHYKQQEFKAALQSYRDADEQMASIFNLLPQLVDAKVRQGNQALSQGKSLLAQSHFQKAIDLDRKSLPALTGLDRAQKLDEILRLISESKTAREYFSTSGALEDLELAKETLLSAKQIDSSFPIVDQNIDEVEALIIDHKFKLAMSRAYVALFQRNYGVARNAFAEALVYKPGDSTAQLAQKQALAFDKTASLSGLLSAARRYEQNEQWASAVSSYESILQRDINQVSAKLGKIRAQARMDLDLKIRKLLADPLAFGKQSHKQKAEQLLSEAKALSSNQGAVLQRQISEIENSMTQFEREQRVKITSDNSTEITLKKIGMKPLFLGRFEERRLALKPGRYIAEARRLGYRDVVVELELLPNRTGIQEFNIVCDQAISTGTSSASTRSSGH